MTKVSLYDLYFINNDWNPNTILRINIRNNIERMSAPKSVEKYGEMGVKWFQDDYVSLCCKEDINEN